jgi:hypothetical protein
MTGMNIRYFAALVAISVCDASLAGAQVLAPNPTPEMYVANNKGGSRIIPNGQLSFDGQSFTCARFPTVEDPLLSAPRATIRNASSGKGRCNAFASSQGERIQTSRSSSVVKITGLNLGWNRLDHRVGRRG